MTPSNDLHELIHSLTKMEKRYFKIYVSRSPGAKQPLAIKVFDAIAKQKIYDEKALLKAFKDENFASNFPAYKNHIYTTVLRALAHYRESATASDSIDVQLRQVRILIENNLYKQAFKLNQRLKNRATEAEDFGAVMESIELDRKMLVARSGEYLFDAPPDEMIERLSGKSLSVLEQWQRVIELQKIQMMLFDAHLNFERRFSSWQEAASWAEIQMQHEFFSGGQALLSFAEFVIFHYTQFIYEVQFRGNTAAGLEHALLIVQEYECHPKRIVMDGVGYLRACSWVILAAIWLNDIDLALKYNSIMRQSLEKYHFPRTAEVNRFDLQSYAFEGSILTGLFRNELSEAYIPKALEAMEKWRVLKRSHEEVSILIACIQLYYEMQRYNECIALCTRYLTTQEYLKAESHVRVYLSLAHFALGNRDILSSIARCSVRYLQHYPLLEHNRLFFLCMNRIAEADSEGKIRKHIQTFIEQFNVHNETLPDDIRDSSFTSVHYIWAMAYLKGVSYREESLLHYRVVTR
ncbi:MAG: hypothetical protein U0264_16520 [Candidatus Kapaibacterium sp.]